MASNYLTMEDMIALHTRQLELFGGAPGVRDAGLIEGALQRPQTGYYTDLIEEAAALWESLAMNHGFVDGNKRIGFAATYIFLRLNGATIEAGEKDVADFVLGLLESGKFKKETLEDWLHQHVKHAET